MYLNKLNLQGKYSIEKLDMGKNDKNIEKYLYKVKVQNKFLRRYTKFYTENNDKSLYQN